MNVTDCFLYFLALSESLNINVPVPEIAEVKQRRDWSVPKWVSAWEYQVSLEVRVMQ